ncbi:hypothetical protein GeomeDRAFT_2372 [Geobacter metallireducens RCH3]|uniref:Uncharacterized protein n=1 Tax=Geobacter metallireducens (strain ATCC 53774 / DSM 7210 / GS-15) TaxID=269799 RepID=Q39WN8_GEOMG|nr:hypothetical protein [Geobacter metallireducens]ABB31336.1 hypothetical protein Gmet_1096 [Geobacter metallireducens GS-15]EHP85662.1 hypothetical protein GeomeDRAFT_2372 [Geobacter metallireducens RCH3]
METLYTVMAFITVSVAAILIPRMMIDWQRCREFLRDSDGEALRRFVAEQRQWIVRHGMCAAGAIGMVAVITCAPGMAAYERLAGVMTAYGMMTLTFMFIESLLAQRAESLLQARSASVEQAREFGN